MYIFETTVYEHEHCNDNNIIFVYFFFQLYIRINKHSHPYFLFAFIVDDKIKGLIPELVDIFCSLEYIQSSAIAAIMSFFFNVQSFHF